MKLTKGEVALLIGSNLRGIRMSKHITIEKLAFDSGMDSKQIIRIELGQINTSIFQIYRVIRAMKIHMYEVFLFSDK
jgi:transcriptional regulator with XRE-family HTH domain